MRAKQRVKQAKRLLKEAGMGEERVEMFHIGASDAQLFVAACNEMTERARKLGPNPLRKKEEKVKSQ